MSGRPPGSAPPRAEERAEPGPPDSHTSGRVARVVTNLPARLPVLFFWVTLVVAVSVLLEVFTPWVVVPAVGVLWALTWNWGPAPVRPDREAVRGAAWALGLVAVWVLANLWYASEVLLVQRDPGFLTLMGLWLSEHADPDIPARTALEVAAQLPGAQVTSDAFWQAGTDIYAQGAKTFPGLTALGGWLLGRPGVLAANLVIGGIGLLAVYDLARRVITPRWALLPMAALALTTPMIYFSRTAFTEPTNIVLTFGGLAVLWSAYRDPRLWRFGLGGAMVGATALSRIDGAAVAAGLVVGLGVVVAGARDPQRRRRLAGGFVVASASAAAMVLLGYLDVHVHSTDYLRNHAFLYQPLIALFVGCFVVAALAIAVARIPVIRGWLAAHHRGLGTAAAVGVIAIAVLLASRPLWMQAHGIQAGTPTEWFIARAQEAAGVAVDGTRSYDEMTVMWLGWYLGPVTLALAAVGAALMARTAIVRRRPELIVVLVTLGVPALIYFLRPSITPDQVWAMRRFLPAVLPAVLLCAAWLLHRVLTRARGRWARAAGWGAVVLMLVSPLATWGSVILTTEYGGRAAQMDALCGHVRSGRVVVVRAAEPPLLPTLRIMCDADVIEMRAPMDAEGLAQVRRAWDDQPVLVVTGTEGAIPWPDGQAPTISTPMARWPHSLYPTRSPVRFTSDLWVGSVGPDGSVTPVGS